MTVIDDASTAIGDASTAIDDASTARQSTTIDASMHPKIDHKRSAAEAVACKSAGLREDTATPACRELVV